MLSIPTLMLLAGAGTGALVLMHAFARTKQSSELMLKTYEDMLTEARRKRREKQRSQAAAAAKKEETPAVVPHGVNPTSSALSGQDPATP